MNLHPSENLNPKRNRQGSSWWIVLILVALVLALLVAALFGITRLWNQVVRAPGAMIESTTDAGLRAARRVSGALGELFQVTPEILLDSQVVEKQSSPIAQLALIKREYPLKFTWKHEWLRSAKQVQVTGSAFAKAGFDLDKRFLISVNTETRSLIVELPNPEILSVDWGDDVQLDGTSGWLNRLSDADRTEALRAFRRAVKQHIDDSSLLEEARTEALRRTHDLAKDPTWNIQIRFSSPAAENVLDPSLNP
ncbi:MAG: DUF4230 domain-containing protein [Candidatus Methylacidiphilales bacterium]